MQAVVSNDGSKYHTSLHKNVFYEKKLGVDFYDYTRNYCVCIRMKFN